MVSALTEMPLRIDRIIGHRLDDALHAQLHDIGHHGGIDLLHLPAADLPRRRLQAQTMAGRVVQISLPRDQRLGDGAVLWMEGDSAIIVRVRERAVLRLSPRSAADALALGYHAGNLHWTVRFVAADLLVSLDGPPEAYLARIGELATPGRLGVTVIEDGAC